MEGNRVHPNPVGLSERSYLDWNMDLPLVELFGLSRRC